MLAAAKKELGDDKLSRGVPRHIRDGLYRPERGERGVVLSLKRLKRFVIPHGFLENRSAINSS